MASHNNMAKPALKLTKDRSRARMAGGVLEFQLAGLVAARLRTLRRQRPDLHLRFQLATNVDGANPFDDLVVRLRWRHHYHGRPCACTYFVQLKHAEKLDKPVHALDLASEKVNKKNKDFNLRKYFDFHKRLADTARLPPARAAGNARLMADWAKEDYRFVLFTTREVLPGTKRSREASPLDFPFEDVFSTGQGEIFSIGEAVKDVWQMMGDSPDDEQFLRWEFLPRLRVFGSQAQVSGLPALLDQAVQEALGVDSHPDRPLKYSDFLQKWWENEDGSCLTEETTELEDLLRDEIMSSLNLQELSFKSTGVCEKSLRGFKCSFVVVDGVPAKVRTSKMIKDVLNDVCSSYIILTDESLIKYSSETLALMCINLCQNMLPKSKFYVLVNVDNFDGNVSNFLKMISIVKRCNVKVLSSEWNLRAFEIMASRVQPCVAWSERWTLNDLEPSEQRNILQHNVCFQGVELPLRDLCPAWPSLPRALRGASLGAVAAGQPLALGAPLPPLDHLYVARALEHRLTLRDALFRLRSPVDFFLLADFPHDTLHALREPHAAWQECSGSSDYMLPRGGVGGEGKNRGTRCRSEDPPGERPCRTKWKVWDPNDDHTPPKGYNVHWLAYEKGKIAWQRSEGDTQCLAEYAKQMSDGCQLAPVCCHTDARDFIHWKESTLLLLDNVGAGKSTFTNKMALTFKEQRKNRWSVVVRISEGNLMEKMPAEPKMQDVLELIQYYAGVDQAAAASSEKLFLKESLEKSGMAVLVDGLDELCASLQSKALRVVQLLQQAVAASGGWLWVASRTVLGGDLSNTLGCVTPLSLRTFSARDQQSYLLSYWTTCLKGVDEQQLMKQVHSLVSAVRLATSCGDKSLCDVPLYTRMLADCYTVEDLMQLTSERKINLVSLMNTPSLYKRFVTRTLHLVWEKAGISQSQRMNFYAESDEVILEKHKLYAAWECFGDSQLLGVHFDKLKKVVNELSCGFQKEKAVGTGLITDVVDGKPKFLHYSIAEYLAASWLKDNYSSLPELTTSLYQGKFKEVRFFFDGLFANGFPLHEAALSGCAESVETLLKEEHVLVNEEDRGGRRPLHLAAISGHDLVVRLLLNHRAKVEVTDNVLGWTPLRYADGVAYVSLLAGVKTVSSVVRVVEQLLEFGASLQSARNLQRERKLALQISLASDYVHIAKALIKQKGPILIQKWMNKDYMKIAAQNGCVKTVAMLARWGFSVNVDLGKGETPLHVMARRGEEKSCSDLLRHGASTNTKNQTGNTPLREAAKNGHEKVCRLLLEWGADVNVAGKGGSTALHWAAKQGREQVCGMMLKTGAAVNVVDNYGWNALHLAAKGGKEDVCHLLLRSGAQPNVAQYDGWTALHWATYEGHDAVCRVLVNNGALVNCTDNDGCSALHIAAKEGRQSLCQLLLDHGAHPDAKNDAHESPVHLAANEGNDALCQLFASYGANVNAENTMKETPLHLASSKGFESTCECLLQNGAKIGGTNKNREHALHYAAKDGHVDVCRCLLEHKANVNAAANNGFTSLHWAVKQNHASVCRVLIEFGAQVNVRSLSSDTCLHMAAQGGNGPLCQLLVTSGADVNAVNKDGESPLHYAAKEGLESACRLFVKRGAQLDAVNKNGETALHYGAQNNQLSVCYLLLIKNANVNAVTKTRDTPLHLAASENLLLICRLLLTMGAQVNARNFNGSTALHLATKVGHDTICQWLLENGADINSKEKYDWCALHWAANCGHSTVCRLLAEHGADLEATTKYGETAFQKAAKKGHLSVCHILQQSGADVNSSDADGWSPILWAAKKGNKAMLQFLVEHGADVNATEKFSWTALHWAAYRDLLPMSQFLLENGANVNAKTKRGETPLHKASKMGHDQMCDFLLQHGAEILIATDIGDLPLHYAAREGYEKVYTILIKHGANVNAVNLEGASALHLSSAQGHVHVCKLLLQDEASVNLPNRNDETPLHKAAKKGQEKVCELLMDNGAHVNAVDRNGGTPLHGAAKEGDEATCRALMLKGCANVNAANSRGETPIHIVAREGRKQLCRVLLAHSAEVNVPNHSKETPLHLAARAGHKTVTQFLVEHGADVHLADSAGKTTLHLAAEENHETICQLLLDYGASVDAADTNGWTALLFASAGGHDRICHLLVRRGANVGATENCKWTALHWATNKGHASVCRYLLDHGANPDAADSNGWTALHWAGSKGLAAVARLLVDRGANVNARTNCKETALHKAAKKGQTELVRLLVDARANASARDEDGWTALHWAASNGDRELCDALLERGANPGAVDSAGETPFKKAADNGHNDVCFCLLDH